MPNVPLSYFFTEVCLVTAELLSVVRYIKRHDMVKMEYSIPDVVDFTNPKERSWLRKDTGHFCYPWYVHWGDI